MLHTLDSMKSWDPELNQSLSFKLHQVVKLLHHQADRILEDELGITFSQFLVLKVSGCSDEPSQRDVAQRLDITPAAISRHIDGLCERGLMVKSKKPDNRREHDLQLTELGANKVASAQQILSERFDTILARELKPAEIEQLGGSLDKIAAALGSDKVAYEKGERA